jgi:hypothetical protein
MGPSTPLLDKAFSAASFPLRLWTGSVKRSGSLRIASKNKVLKISMAMGYYGTHTPGDLQHLGKTPCLVLIAHTPYQAEILRRPDGRLINFRP